jgi:hypothetical protein
VPVGLPGVRIERAVADQLDQVELVRPGEPEGERRLEGPRGRDRVGVERVPDVLLAGPDEPDEAVQRLA